MSEQNQHVKFSLFYVVIKVVVVVIKGQISGHWEQGVTRGNRGNKEEQGVTRGNKEEHGVTKGKQEVTGVARGNKGQQEEHG